MPLKFTVPEDPHAYPYPPLVVLDLVRSRSFKSMMVRERGKSWMHATSFAMIQHTPSGLSVRQVWFDELYREPTWPPRLTPIAISLHGDREWPPQVPVTIVPASVLDQRSDEIAIVGWDFGQTDDNVHYWHGMSIVRDPSIRDASIRIRKASQNLAKTALWNPPICEENANLGLLNSLMNKGS